MSKGTLGQVVKRAISDAAFRRQLQADPEGALKGFDLTGDERAALRSGDASKLSSLGVDQRMSKVFAASEGAAAASKWAGSDVSVGMNVPIVEGASVGDALVTGGGRVNDALINDAGASVRSTVTDGERLGQVNAAFEGGDTAVRSTVTDGERLGQVNAAFEGGDSAGGHSSLDISGNTRDASVIAPDAAGRQTDAFITADEAGNNVVAGGSTGGQSSLDISGNTRDTSVTSSDLGGRQTDAFLTADEMGNDVSAAVRAPDPDTALTQRALADDAAMANPEGHTQPDPNA